MLECSQNGHCHVFVGVGQPKFDICEDFATGCFGDIQLKILLLGGLIISIYSCPSVQTDLQQKRSKALFEASQVYVHVHVHGPGHGNG